MIAGQRRAGVETVVSVNYKDVLEQAVLNERRRILFNLRRRVEKLQTTKQRSGSYSSDDRTAREFRADVLKEITYEENAE